MTDKDGQGLGRRQAAGQRAGRGRPASRRHDRCSCPGGADGDRAAGPLEYIATLQNSVIRSTEKVEARQVRTTGAPVRITLRRSSKGGDLLVPGRVPSTRASAAPSCRDKLDFLSLMLALFCGTASLPHILIRYYTVKDQAAARKSTVVGIAGHRVLLRADALPGPGRDDQRRAIDPTNNNMAAPLLARSVRRAAVRGHLGHRVHDGARHGQRPDHGRQRRGRPRPADQLLEDPDLDDHGKVRAGKIAAVVVGAIAMVLGIAVREMNVSFLVGWAFNVAASANLPALVMLLFWKRTTKQGITAAIIVGMVVVARLAAAERPGVQVRLRPRRRRRPRPRSASRASSRSRWGSWCWSSCR